MEQKLNSQGHTQTALRGCRKWSEEAPKQALLVICNQLNDIKRSTGDILQHCGYDLDVGGEMQIGDSAALLRNKIDESYKKLSEAANLLDSLRWLLL